MGLGNRILQRRKQLGMSQEQLAEKLGVSRQSVSKWESDQSTPDYMNLVLLSELFQVSADYLLRGVEGNVTEGGSKDEERAVPLGKKVLNIVLVVSILVNIVFLLNLTQWSKPMKDDDKNVNTAFQLVVAKLDYEQKYIQDYLDSNDNVVQRQALLQALEASGQAQIFAKQLNYESYKKFGVPTKVDEWMFELHRYIYLLILDGNTKLEDYRKYVAFLNRLIINLKNETLNNTDDVKAINNGSTAETIRAWIFAQKD